MPHRLLFHRSLRRVLTESNLERKCLLLFGISLFGLLMSSSWWFSGQTEQLVKESTRQRADGLVNHELQALHWRKLASKSDEDFLPIFDDINKSLVSDKIYDWTLFLPSGEIRPRDVIPGTSEPPDNVHEEGDEEDLAIVRRFARKAPPSGDAGPRYFERRIPEAKKYVYYQPIRLQRSCLICHTLLNGGSEPAVPGMALADEGDLKAVMKIEIPDGPIQHEIAVNRAFQLALAIITTFLAMLATYVIVRYVIVKPLKHLRDVSDQISHGEHHTIAEIHTGDEFEELATAFNRMVRHMTEAQAELRGSNQALDQKVDELAEVNLKLFEANRMKSDFLATMSHELRTPLNAILGFSDVLGAINTLDDKQMRYVRNIQNSGRALLEMINDILDLAKIESGKMDLRLSTFQIDQVISPLCDMARPLSERKNIDLECAINPDLPPMFQDQAKVQQILNNLLSNAIKFTPEGGRIVVAANKSEDEQRLLLTVTDTGIGISVEDQAVIFEKFRQGKAVLAGDDAMTREYSGTGLGLSIVKELCKLLGGEVSLESEIGRGSTFTIELPFAREPRAELAA